MSIHKPVYKIQTKIRLCGSSEKPLTIGKFDVYDNEDLVAAIDDSEDDQEQTLETPVVRNFDIPDMYSSDLSPEEILSQPSSSLATEVQKQETAAAEDDEFFFTKKSSNTVSDSLDPDHLEFSDKSKPTLNPTELSKWEDEEMLESIRDAPDGDGNDEAGGDGEKGEGDDDEGGGGFVDFEAIAAVKARFDEEYDDPSGPSMDFYSEKTAEISSQLELNRAESASITDLEAPAQLEGYIRETYAQIRIRSSYNFQKRAVVLEPEEKRAVALLQQIRASRKDQVQRRKEKKEAGKEEEEESGRREE
ncbi:hypothetical protein F5050DRAFT_1715452 [Lentinula boryana]|uniref:Uncharacterized protein n=1 Tax=Lentinula boryana TaxID=40481 RepID=A0ABQ8Q0M9_9AGAR|nr:hypothetical protein F5050DRAFT_1715452 [Lentinula boryana]